MKSARRVVMALVATATAFTATGCSNGLDVPKMFCGATVKKSTLSPLLPDGDELKNLLFAPTPSELDCSLHVDGVEVLDTEVRWIDEPLAPEDWKTAGSIYRKASKRRVSFPGTAVIGTNGARITAKCVGAVPDFLLFNVVFDGDRVENSQAGVDKLQRFLEDYVPAMAKHLGCTK